VVQNRMLSTSNIRDVLPFFFPLPGGCHSMIRHQMLVKHTTVLHLRFSMTYHVATRAVHFKKQVSSYILKRLKRRHHRCIPRKLFLNISGTASPGSMCYATYIQRQRSQEQSISRIYMGSWTTPPNKRNTSPSRVLLSLALCEKRKGKRTNGAELALNNNMPVAVTAISTKLHKSRDQPEHEMAALKSSAVPGAVLSVDTDKFRRA